MSSPASRDPLEHALRRDERGRGEHRHLRVRPQRDRPLDPQVQRDVVRPAGRRRTGCGAGRGAAPADDGVHGSASAPRRTTTRQPIAVSARSAQSRTAIPVVAAAASVTGRCATQDGQRGGDALVRRGAPRRGSCRRPARRGGRAAAARPPPGRRATRRRSAAACRAAGAGWPGPAAPSAATSRRSATSMRTGPQPLEQTGDDPPNRVSITRSRSRRAGPAPRPASSGSSSTLVSSAALSRTGQHVLGPSRWPGAPGPPTPARPRRGRRRRAARSGRPRGGSPRPGAPGGRSAPRGPPSPAASRSAPASQCGTSTSGRGAPLGSALTATAPATVPRPDAEAGAGGHGLDIGSVAPGRTRSHRISRPSAHVIPRTPARSAQSPSSEPRRRRLCRSRTCLWTAPARRAAVRPRFASCRTDASLPASPGRRPQQRPRCGHQRKQLRRRDVVRLSRAPTSRSRSRVTSRPGGRRPADRTAGGGRQPFRRRLSCGGSRSPPAGGPPSTSRSARGRPSGPVRTGPSIAARCRATTSTRRRGFPVTTPRPDMARPGHGRWRQQRSSPSPISCSGHGLHDPGPADAAGPPTVGQGLGPGTSGAPGGRPARPNHRWSRCCAGCSMRPSCLGLSCQHEVRTAGGRLIGRADLAWPDRYGARRVRRRHPPRATTCS